MKHKPQSTFHEATQGTGATLVASVNLGLMNPAIGTTSVKIRIDLAHRADQLQTEVLRQLLAGPPVGLAPPRVSRAQVIQRALSRGLALLELESAVQDIAARQGIGS